MKDLTRLLLPIAVAVGLTAVGADWPTYQGDFARSGVSPDPLPATLTEAWSWRSVHPPQPAWQGEAKWDGWNKVYDLKPRQVFDRAFHPVISGGRVYFGSSADDKVYCLDAAHGTELWTFYTEGPVRFAPTIAEGRVYAGSDDGRVYCLDAADGALIWSRRLGPADRRIPGNGRVISAWPVRTSVVVQEGVLYAAAGMFPSEGVHLVALDAATGEERWRQVQTDLPAQGYLVASRTRLYFPAGRNNPVVCDAANGQRLRVLEGAGGTYALLTGDMLVFGPGKTGQLGVVEEGHADQLASFQGLHLIVLGGRSYLHSETELSALDRARYLDLARQRKALAAEQGVLVKRLRDLERKGDPASEAGGLKERLAELGQKIDDTTVAMQGCHLWTVPCQWPDSLALAGDALVAGGEDQVAGFASGTGERLWTRRVEGRAYGLAAAGGRLWVSTGRGVIHCFAADELHASR